MELCYNLEIETLLDHLVQTPGASDLLITVGKPPQLRIYNQISSLNLPVLTAQDTEKLAMAVLNEEQQNRFRMEREIDVSLILPNNSRFRVNIFSQRASLAMAVRVIANRIPTLDELHIPPIVHKLAQLRAGLVLFTGPTGTGKTTSVASVIDFINRSRPCHIISIEDPIEYIHPHAKAVVDQREIGTDTYSFQEALRRILRQSPDVIFIGEMRDQVSAQAALTLAETGHLTFATLHTRGAVAAINRLLDLFPPEQAHQIRSQLSLSLAAIIWQQLFPRKNQPGLILACELLIAIPAIRALIRQGRIHEIQNILQSGRKYGMQTMDQALGELVQKNLIEPEWCTQNHLKLHNLDP